MTFKPTSIFILDQPLTNSEQGSTYHLLLSQVTAERKVGRVAVRELIDNIEDLGQLGQLVEHAYSDVLVCHDKAR